MRGEEIRKDLGRIFILFFCEDFGEIIVKVLKGDEGEVVGMRFVDICLKAKYKNNPMCNVFKEAEYLF